MRSIQIARIDLYGVQWVGLRQTKFSIYYYYYKYVYHCYHRAIHIQMQSEAGRVQSCLTLILHFCSIYFSSLFNSLVPLARLDVPIILQQYRITIQ